MGPHFSRNRGLVSYSWKASPLQELVEATSLHTNFGSFRFAFIALIENRRSWEAFPLGQRSHRFITILVLNVSTGERNATICYEQETWVKRLTYLTR